LQGVFIDGRSIPQPTGALRTFQRKSCNDAAPLTASWNSLATSTSVATPGVVGQLNTGLVRICISEVADATNANFEYVEIFVE
jgi:hypothetical protein